LKRIQTKQLRQKEGNMHFGWERGMLWVCTGLGH